MGGDLRPLHRNGGSKEHLGVSWVVRTQTVAFWMTQVRQN